MDYDDYRCGDCDGRYCGSTCTYQPGYVWVVGRGWASPAKARALEATGRTVHWDKLVIR